MAEPGDGNPFRLDSAALLEEVQLFQRRLAEGVGKLREIGAVEVGATPREALYSEGKLTLYRYAPARPRPELGPLLIVYALVNRPYMVDLQPDRSLLRGLLDAGLEVYLVDWGYPDAGDRELTLDSYVNGYLARCVDTVCARHGGRPLNLLGICQGGTLSLCYAALHPERVARLVTMVTPVDFQTPDNLLGHWARELDVDLLVDSLGNVPGEWLNWVFLALKPFRLTGKKYVDLLDLCDDADQLRNFLRMERWIFDSPDQAGEAFREFVKAFYQRNALVDGSLELGGRRVDLRALSMPLLNVYATEDHLVPPAASQALRGLVGCDDYTEYAFRGGHIGIYVSSRARAVPGRIADWLAARAGSAP
ncbi:MAG TPA: class III poly(R)-hydroxyalkanoic acid synthase subunit PhaC [Gammaproteobacteria bacterium]